MVDELVLGQSLDLAGAARQDRSPELAQVTTLLKSGQYTVTDPLRLGAALAGVGELPAELVGYGDLVGEAFQLRDDLLGVFGDPRRTGKPVGDDLASGKPTQLLAYAAEMLPAYGQALLALAGTSALTRADIAELSSGLIQCGARDRVELKLRRNVRQACDLTDRAAVPPPVAAALRSLAMAVTDRRQ
jgi:geranylgeranyl diphosphate synthase type I